MVWSGKGSDSLDSLGQDPDHPNYVHLCPPAQTGTSHYAEIYMFIYTYIYVYVHCARKVGFQTAHQADRLMRSLEMRSQRTHRVVGFRAWGFRV